MAWKKVTQCAARSAPIAIRNSGNARAAPLLLARSGRERLLLLIATAIPSASTANRLRHQTIVTGESANHLPNRPASPKSRTRRGSRRARSSRRLLALPPPESGATGANNSRSNQRGVYIPLLTNSDMINPGTINARPR